MSKRKKYAITNRSLRAKPAPAAAAKAQWVREHMATQAELERVKQQHKQLVTDYRNLRQTFHETQQQRDALLAACKAQLDAHTPYMIRAAAATARAAIAAAEEVQQ